MSASPASSSSANSSAGNAGSASAGAADDRSTSGSVGLASAGTADDSSCELGSDEFFSEVASDVEETDGESSDDVSQTISFSNEARRELTEEVQAWQRQVVCWVVCFLRTTQWVLPREVAVGLANKIMAWSEAKLVAAACLWIVTGLDHTKGKRLRQIIHVSPEEFYEAVHDVMDEPEFEAFYRFDGSGQIEKHWKNSELLQVALRGLVHYYVRVEPLSSQLSPDECDFAERISRWLSNERRVTVPPGAWAGACILLAASSVRGQNGLDVGQMHRVCKVGVNDLNDCSKELKRLQHQSSTFPKPTAAATTTTTLPPAADPPSVDHQMPALSSSMEPSTPAAPRTGRSRKRRARKQTGTASANAHTPASSSSAEHSPAAAPRRARGRKRRAGGQLDRKNKKQLFRN